MKKFYLIATAVTMLTACTNSEKLTADFSNDGPVMIGFETFHEKATKATPTGEIIDKTKLTKEHGGFGVWGFKGDKDDIVAAADPNEGNNGEGIDHTQIVNINDETKYTSIFGNVMVWYENASTKTQGFTYTVPKYWDKYSEYIFFAYAPYDAPPEDRICVATIVEACNKWEWWAPYCTNIIIQGYFANQNFEESIHTLGFEYLINQQNTNHSRME